MTKYLKLNSSLTGPKVGGYMWEHHIITIRLILTCILAILLEYICYALMTYRKLVNNKYVEVYHTHSNKFCDRKHQRKIWSLLNKIRLQFKFNERLELENKLKYYVRREWKN